MNVKRPAEVVRSFFGDTCCFGSSAIKKKAREFINSSSRMGNKLIERSRLCSFAALIMHCVLIIENRSGAVSTETALANQRFTIISLANFNTR